MRALLRDVAEPLDIRLAWVFVELIMLCASLWPRPRVVGYGQPRQHPPTLTIGPLSRSAAAIQTALAQLNANQNEQAKVTLRRVLQKDPAEPDANKLMGMLLSGLNENEQALFFLKRAAQSAPKDSQLRFMLGNLYMIMRRDKEAIATFRDALRLDPATLPAVDGLGKCLLRGGDHTGAVAAYEAGIAASPDNPVAYRAMASALSTMGRVPEALAALRRGVQRLPADTGLRESLCYQSNFADDMTKEEVFEEHVALGRLVHQEGLKRPTPRLTSNKSPDSPLRVGFLSGEFCVHACATFMEGLIRELDHASFQPFLYYVRPEVEPPTRRFAAMVGPNQWRHVPGIPNQHLAQVIAADSLDILIDTMGWTEHQRMGAMEPRLAPIQATWLGYPNTTGLPSMDYRIVDAITDPPGAEAYCTEKLLRLPGCFLSYLPDPTAPEPATTPALLAPTSDITFGSFNRLSKVGPEVARTWAAILRAVPGSHLLLKSSLVSEDVKAQYMREFAAEGIGAERLIWSSFVDTMHNHLAMYHQVDIALDSFPYNGTTTTCEATWMGVPVITLAGDVGVHRARVGASLLTAVGLPELVASIADELCDRGSAKDAQPATALRLAPGIRRACAPTHGRLAFVRRPRLRPLLRNRPPHRVASLLRTSLTHPHAQARPIARHLPRPIAHPLRDNKPQYHLLACTFRSSSPSTPATRASTPSSPASISPLAAQTRPCSSPSVPRTWTQRPSATARTWPSSSWPAASRSLQSQSSAPCSNSSLTTRRAMLSLANALLAHRLAGKALILCQRGPSRWLALRNSPFPAPCRCSRLADYDDAPSRSSRTPQPKLATSHAWPSRSRRPWSGSPRPARRTGQGSAPRRRLFSSRKNLLLPRRIRAGQGPDRRLRIGLISPDLRQHSVAYFIEPFLRILRPCHISRCGLLFHQPDLRRRQPPPQVPCHTLATTTTLSTNLSPPSARKDRIDIAIDLASGQT